VLDKLFAVDQGKSQGRIYLNVGVKARCLKFRRVVVFSNVDGPTLFIDKCAMRIDQILGTLQILF
jgi:hypothetical protein